MTKLLLTVNNADWKSDFSDILDFVDPTLKEQFINKYLFNNENVSYTTYFDSITETVSIRWNSQTEIDFIVNRKEITPDVYEHEYSWYVNKNYGIMQEDGKLFYFFLTYDGKFKSVKQIKYKGYLDIFMTYDIKEIWKDNALANIKRAHYPQWKIHLNNYVPYHDITKRDSPIFNIENIPITESDLKVESVSYPLSNLDYMNNHPNRKTAKWVLSQLSWTIRYFTTAENGTMTFPNNMLKVLKRKSDESIDIVDNPKFEQTFFNSWNSSEYGESQIKVPYVIFITCNTKSVVWEGVKYNIDFVYRAMSSGAIRESIPLNFFEPNDPSTVYALSTGTYQLATTSTITTLSDFPFVIDFDESNFSVYKTNTIKIIVNITDIGNVVLLQEPQNTNSQYLFYLQNPNNTIQDIIMQSDLEGIPKLPVPTSATDFDKKYELKLYGEPFRHFGISKE